jgi:2-hydroxy-3-keto-5-methylthiopentenyl-1-phosphate phosphatase
MQEYAFIPELGVTAKDFWAECNRAALKHSMDGILAYMYVMVYKSKMPLTKERLQAQGKHVELFRGVAEWFARIDKYAKAAGVNVEHYIISSGLKQIILGTEIAKYFKEVYACDFVYNDEGIAVWPSYAMNYTSKTQFLFRINKGITEITSDRALNAPTHEDDRRVPFRNMIYIGDGITDVPCMKLVKMNGGHAVGVYQNGDKSALSEMLLADRIDYIVASDYSEGSEIDKIVKLIIEKAAPDGALKRISRGHYIDAKKEETIKSCRILGE